MTCPRTGTREFDENWAAAKEKCEACRSERRPGAHPPACVVQRREEGGLGDGRQPAVGDVPPLPDGKRLEHSRVRVLHPRADPLEVARELPAKEVLLECRRRAAEDGGAAWNRQEED